MKVRVGETEYLDIDTIEDVDLDVEEYYVDGERLTEARAEAIAREVMRRHGLKGGRPPLAPAGSQRIGFRVPADLHARLKARAKADHQSESYVARQALERYLEPAA